MLDQFHAHYGDTFLSFSDEFLTTLLSGYGGNYRKTAEHLEMILNNSKAIAAANHAIALGKTPPTIAIQSEPRSQVDAVPFVGLFWS